MTINEKMYMLTVRYHPNNIDYFEDFLSFFLNYAEQRWDTYLASIEMDDTPDRHMHCIFNDNKSKDRSKIQDYLNRAFKPFYEKIKSSETKADKKLRQYAFNLSDKYKDEEVYWRMGYPLKDNPKRVFIKGITEHEQKIYKINYQRHIELELKKPENVFGITQLTVKNALAKIQDYYIKNKTKLTFTKLGSNLKYEMIKDKYSLIEINDNTFKKIYQHIRIWNDIGDIAEIAEELYAYDENDIASNDLMEASKITLINKIEYQEKLIKELKSKIIQYEIELESN